MGSVGVSGAFIAKAGEAEQPSLTLAPLVDLINRGEFDLVATGRAILADPAWGDKVASGRVAEIRPYDKSVDQELY